MNYKYTIPTLFILTSISLASPARSQNSLCTKEIDEIAQKITVLIDSKNSGSGTIIKRDGNTYTVLTSFHNVSDKSLKYTLITADGQRYSINVSSLQPLGANIDLTVVQFNSNKSYQVAKIGNSDSAKRLDNVYTAGFPAKTGGINTFLYECRNGQINANATQATIDGGYNLLYTNKILKGMSGGPTLNQQGELIGINGLIDINKEKNTDRYASVPINTYLRIASGVGTPIKPQGGGLKADDYFALAADKYAKGDYKGAIIALEEAIKINPNDALAYYNRGVVRSALGDKQAAITDYNQAIKINPNDADAYYNRGNVRSALGDKQAAITDYSQAIKINPNYAYAYYNRGNARSALGDKQAAIADYNQAIKINPNYAIAYISRGNARSDLGDKQAAITDYNQAIKINPNDAYAYHGRGNAYAALGDKFKAISDFQQAVRLYQQQGGNEKWLKIAQDRIRELQQ
ncbi:tetratricopeptide repeat-containing serine protease family protein [Anabaena sp. UHCC 0204]|uniref:tetratricopeptide repeat-containing S1 family peptidase n=1 Tax=Anabaena sp. UHCC 0204 TaxID=2590009 RepID=UPI00144820A0|nr:tetratricopeptide repeat-containing serine protease family protein [Anabaena sp. UHCC 0204]MTJ06427.1 serine protease [Anabaena sp. UHCC 0204]